MKGLIGQYSQFKKLEVESTNTYKVTIFIKVKYQRLRCKEKKKGLAILRSSLVQLLSRPGFERSQFQLQINSNNGSVNTPRDFKGNCVLLKILETSRRVKNYLNESAIL